MNKRLKKKLAAFIIASLTTVSLQTSVFAEEVYEAGTVDAVEDAELLSSEAALDENTGTYDPTENTFTAADGSYTLYFKDNGSGISMIMCMGTAKQLTISENYGGKTVIAIGEDLGSDSGKPAFFGSTEGSASPLEEIIIPNTVTTIQSRAFAACSSLKEFDMPDSVTTIGWGCFADCTALEALKLSNKITKADDLCSECTNLKKLYYPKSAKINMGTSGAGDIGFYNCNSLKEIYFSGSASEWTNLAKEMVELHNIYNSVVFEANIHFGSTVDDFWKDKNAGTNEANLSCDRKTVTNNGIEISYDSSVPFFGKKAKPENFNITISSNGQTYKATKVKYNKKTKKLNITNISPANKDVKKAVKNATKGSNGLEINMLPYFIKSSDETKSKFAGMVKGFKYFKIKLNNKFYTCDKRKIYAVIMSTKDPNATGDIYACVNDDNAIGIYKCR